MIKYCKNCLFPETKPDLEFNNKGVCNACTNYFNRPEVDWNNRREEFIELASSIKSESNWDCVIPISGGKDSTYQALKAKKYGLNPLLVNSRTCDLSSIGRKNIDNLRSLGFDAIEVLPNPKIRSKLNLIGLKEVGDISWPEHIGMFTIPFTIALKFDIPIIFYGENPQHEYGGPEHFVNNRHQDRRWLEEIGGTLGMRLEDVLLSEEIERKDLNIYKFPDSKDLKERNIRAYYLGYFFPWNGLSNYILSQAHGMLSYGEPVEGSLVDYENLDNHQNGIHEYLKILKHGYGRITDQASILIRRELITREEGLEIVKKNEIKFPWTYLGKSIEEIIEPLGITLDYLVEVFDNFTNKNLFRLNKDGSIYKNTDGSPEKINYDNE